MGRFSVTSSKGYKYAMIIYNYNFNTILATPLKPKNTTEYLHTIQDMHEFLNQWGIHSKIYIMDNEYPQVVKDYVKMNNK